MFGIPSPWLIGGAAVAAVVYTGVVFTTGVNYANRKNDVDNLKAEIETLHFDAGETARKNKEADADAGLIEEAAASDEEKINVAEAILARGYGCPLPAELEWLRGIGEAGPVKKPPPTPELREAGASAAAQGCDPWPIIAARERAGRVKANNIIVKFRGWYDGLRSDYAKGAVK